MPREILVLLCCVGSGCSVAVAEVRRMVATRAPVEGSQRSAAMSVRFNPRTFPATNSAVVSENSGPCVHVVVLCGRLQNLPGRAMS